MSEPKLISPLLDGFLMGSPMSDHNGVVCCPAMKENSDHKYIVKIISVPASQKQLDALLLAGAYRDPADAMDYFKDLADDVIREAQCLQELSRLEGFLPYEAWQVEPLERNELGYQVYLLGSYKRSLEKHMRRTMLTHLDAINLGLDLCSALAAVRRAGYIYLDLKPTNIFLSEDKSYRIGDLGFIALDAFRYTALPSKYISRYTPPELQDPMAQLNETADTYALGMILYQIYNDGNLPPQPEDPAAAYPNPLNADYELAEIILKAIAPKPEDRWKDPQEMGQALAAYLQRNNVNETPVTPPSTVIYDPADVVKEEPQEIPEEAPTVEQIREEVQEEAPEIPADETAPTAEDAPSPEEEIPLSDEVSSIMAHADDLLSHETPKGVEVPDPEDLPDPFADFDPEAGEDWAALAQEPEDPVLSDPIHEMDTPPAPPRKKRRFGKILAKLLITLLVLAGLGGGGYYFYQNFFLQTIDDILVEGSQNELTVTVTTDVDSSSLTVACIDAYGNAMRQPLVNGKAQFANLQSDSMYRIQLEISGFHKLTGETSEIFTTEARTTIVDFTAVSGSQEGSVLLNFTIDGPEPSEWTLVCSTEGEKPREEVFSGHSVTVKDLTVGKTYTFYLETDGDTKIVGDNRVLEFTVNSLFTAENLTLDSPAPGELLAYWDLPSQAHVDTWMVRCYNDQGFEQKFTVTGTEARFEGLDFSMPYTVEVTAEGMTQPARISISKNPITVSQFQVDDSDPAELKLSWDFSGEAPKGGWLLTYGIDDPEAQNIITCKEPAAAVSPRIPGATYYFQIQTSEGGSLFNSIHQFTVPEAEDFNCGSLSASHVSARLVKTPEDPEWTASSISKEDYRSDYTSGEPISIVLHADQNFYLPDTPISALYVIRNGEGRVLSKMTTKEDLNWKELWTGGDYHDAELDLPVLPKEGGRYSITLYFNGSFMAAADFTITPSGNGSQSNTDVEVSTEAAEDSVLDNGLEVVG